MSVMSDAIITYAILRKFTTPIKDTDAYKMGLVDIDGRPTKESEYNHTEKAKDAYTLLDRLVFKLKRMWASMPAFAKLIGGYGAALAFIKEDQDEFHVFEHLDSTKADYWGQVLLGESIVGIDKHFIIRIAEDATMLRSLVESYQSGTQDSFVFEDESAATPVGNSVSSGQVQGLATEPVITPAMQKKWTSGNRGRKIEELLSN